MRHANYDTTLMFTHMLEERNKIDRLSKLEFVGNPSVKREVYGSRER